MCAATRSLRAQLADLARQSLDLPLLLDVQRIELLGFHSGVDLDLRLCVQPPLELSVLALGGLELFE